MKNINGERAYRIVQMMHVRSRLGYSGKIDDNILHIFEELPESERKALLRVAVRVWSDHEGTIVTPKPAPPVVSSQPEFISVKEEVVQNSQGDQTHENELKEVKSWAMKLTALAAILVMFILTATVAYTVATSTELDSSVVEESADAVIKLLE